METSKNGRKGWARRKRPPQESVIFRGYQLSTLTLWKNDDTRSASEDYWRTSSLFCAGYLLIAYLPLSSEDHHFETWAYKINEMDRGLILTKRTQVVLKSHQCTNSCLLFFSDMLELHTELPTALTWWKLFYFLTVTFTRRHLLTVSICSTNICMVPSISVSPTPFYTSSSLIQLNLITLEVDIWWTAGASHLCT